MTNPYVQVSRFIFILVENMRIVLLLTSRDRQKCVYQLLLLLLAASTSLLLLLLSVMLLMS